MYKNKVKAMLMARQPVLGCIVNGPVPDLVEMIGLAGFDFVFIDVEHSALSLHECQEMVRAAEVRHLVPFIRSPQNDPKVILHYMDMGAMGLVLPEVDTREQAEAAVRAVKFPPLGVRGMASSRSSDYGFGKSKAAYLQEANEETMVIAIIESEEGVANAEEIMATPGLDCIFVGTSDLSMSLGVVGQTNHPLVEAAFDKILRLGLAMDKPIGVIARDGESPTKYFERGVSLSFTTAYSIFKSGAKEFVAQGRSVPVMAR